MTTQKPHLLSRRDFVKLSAFGAAAATLAACAPAVSPGAPAAEAAHGCQHRRQADRPLPVLVVRGRESRHHLEQLHQRVQRIAKRHRGRGRKHSLRPVHDQDHRRRAIGRARRRYRDGDARAGAPPDPVNLLAPLDDILVRNNITDLSSPTTRCARTASSMAWIW